MLFNAPVFLLAFLPIVLAGFFLIGAFRKQEWAILWLVGASLFFYAWWRPEFVFLILGSILFNYLMGLRLGSRPNSGVLTFGVAMNLALLGWFKYSGFLATVMNDLANTDLPVPHFLLPLGISFYTFQQIAYLVDANSGEAHERSLSRYALFVTFFPQLIAGPIVHHREMLSQFHRPETYTPRLENLVLGLAAFSIGLFKKVFIADPLGFPAQLAFGPAAQGIAPPVADAWFGGVAYTLQLYFDFSGYSDMAIGLGLMFGIRLPVNFASPYKSASIIEFWSRWHITLTRFLTSYIYNPLVMTVTRRRMAAGKPTLNQKRPKPTPFVVQLALPTLLTFFLAGIWHGAGWQFVAFGLIHGVLLVVNHAWRAARTIVIPGATFGPLGRAAGVVVTFLAVTFSLVFFRADSFEHALLIAGAMVGFGGTLEGVSSLGGPELSAMGPMQMLIWRLSSMHGLLIAVALAIVWILPNTPQYIERLGGAVERLSESGRSITRWRLRPLRWPATMAAGNRFLQGSCVGVLLALALLRALSVAPSEFLYYTF
jgi:D-alanyl-lipoteichoic acid acyltransferase DltB (MBOAT superfamily)